MAEPLGGATKAQAQVKIAELPAEFKTALNTVRDGYGGLSEDQRAELKNGTLEEHQGLRLTYRQGDEVA